jgi:8-oxo-dGTP pyrophosphatase MutT (NUDIX family)
MFPVSIKGVICQASAEVLLLENDRDEWELPGGRLEPGESPELCLKREICEELGITVEIGPLLDCWVYPVRPDREVVIVTYGVYAPDLANIRLSSEHNRVSFFRLDDLPRIRLPLGYQRAVKLWVPVMIQRQ